MTFTRDPLTKISMFLNVDKLNPLLSNFASVDLQPWLIKIREDQVNIWLNKIRKDQVKIRRLINHQGVIRFNEGLTKAIQDVQTLSEPTYSIDQVKVGAKTK